MNQIGLYGGFIQNYVEAVQVVRKCTQSDPRFRTLAEVLKTVPILLNYWNKLCTNIAPIAWLGLLLFQSMMSNNGAQKARTKYTFEGAYSKLACLLVVVCFDFHYLIAAFLFTALLYKPLDRVTKTTLVLHVRKPLITYLIIFASWAAFSSFLCYFKTVYW